VAGPGAKQRAPHCTSSLFILYIILSVFNFSIKKAFDTKILINVASKCKYVPALGRLRQEDPELEASWGYTVRLCPKNINSKINKIKCESTENLIH
jgi:hypothetical protein